MSKHTHGPWVVEESKGEFFIGPLDRISSRVEAVVVSFGASSARKANARLIAAAPELLEALRGIIGDVGFGCDRPAYVAAQLAIRKAEGRS